jgi:hypothetical protein
MNEAMGHVTALYIFQKDTCPVTPAEEKVLRARPVLVSISTQEYAQG